MSAILNRNSSRMVHSGLAAYIERNQRLKNTNAAYSKQLATSESTMMRKVSLVRDTYDKELLETRRLISETVKDRARLELENQKLRKELHETKEKLDKKTKAAEAGNTSLASLHARFQDLMAKNNKLESEGDTLVRDKKELEDEHARLNLSLEALKRQQLENELLRTDVERQLQTRIEELNLQLRCLQETTESKTQQSLEIHEVNGRLQKEYETKLQQGIQELRAEYEEQLRANKDRYESIYEQKNSDLRAQLEQVRCSSQFVSEELISSTKRLSTISQQLCSVETERDDLVNKIKGFEKKIDIDHARCISLLDDRDSEINRLVSEKSALLSDHQNLKYNEIALSNEIETYRKLLETEERLSLSPKRTPCEAVVCGPRSTSLRVPKRKRVVFENETPDVSLDSNAFADGDIEISQDDPEGKFIRLYNKSKKEVSISGWQLKRLAGGVETCHKFNDQAKIDAHGTMTIWSSNVSETLASAIGCIPASIIMEGKKWNTSDRFRTLLFNGEGQLQAIRETRLLQIIRPKKHPRFDQREELFHQEGELVKRKSCSML